jgi:chromosome segregation ATPase
VPAGVSAGVSSEEIESLLRQKKQVEADNEALAKIVVDEASEKQKLNNKLTHMSAMLGSSLMGNSVASTVSRRASNPVAPTRRITFGNYSVRAEGKNRLSVLHRGGDRPLLDLTKSIESTGDDGDAFSKVKTFIDYQPSAAWEDDNDDRDLGVLEEFEEMEEEEQEEEEEEETVELGHSNLRQSIEHQSERIKDLESQLHDREREIAVLKQSEQEVDGQSYERLQEEVETLRDEANGKQREIEHFEHEYSRVVSESKDISTKMQEMEKQVQDTAEQSSKMDELQATLTEYKLKIASAAQSPVTVPASSSATVTTAEQAATIDRLERDRYDLKLAMKDKSAHLQAANGDLKTAETEFKASQIEMAELRSSLQQAVSAANADAEQRQHEAADHANACKGMEEQLASLRLQVEQLTAEREASVDAKTKVQEQAAQSAIQITQLQESVSELRDSNAMAKKELKEQAEELKRERALHKSEGKSAGSDASKLASMEFKFKSLLQEKNTLGKEKAAAQRETRELKNQMEKLQATVDKADASTGAKKLRLKLDEVMPQLQETKRVEEALREQYQASDKQCTAMQVALREVQIELASCQTDKEAAETRAAESAEQLAGVRVEMQGASESSKSEADELRQQLQTLSSTMETQKGSEMQRVSDEMAELNLTLQSNATQLDAALAECSVMQADIAEKDTLLTAVASELEEKEQLETEMDSTRVKLRQAEARLLELEQASQVHSEMASRLARAATESAAANERVQASESETARLQESHKAAENTIVDLRSSLQMVEAEHVALIEIQHSGEQRQSEVDQLLKAAAQEKEEMVAKVAEMELIATDAVAEVEIKQIELEQLRERYKTLCAQPVASPAGESKLREQVTRDDSTLQPH